MVDKDVTPGEPSLNLRGRDLRFARLDRTDLHQADMTGANLDGASLVDADLRGVWMSCADLNVLLLTDSRRAARCTSVRGANLAKARLGDARMAGADLREARFDEAQLAGTQLAHAAMSGASFASARLDGADLSGAALHGANFILASLQGADLAGAKLQMADFASAGLQGASLSLANLMAAGLRDADLDGANMQMARLTGADLSGAKMAGSDMRGAVVWRTLPPGGEAPAVADMAQIVMQPPTEDELVALGASLAQLESGSLKARLADGLARLSDAAQNSAWGASPDQQAWQGLRQGERGRQRRRLQGAPHRVPGAADVPLAVCQRRGRRRRGAPRHGNGLPGRFARPLRPPQGHRLPRHPRHEPAPHARPRHRRRRRAGAVAGRWLCISMPCCRFLWGCIRRRRRLF